MAERLLAAATAAAENSVAAGVTTRVDTTTGRTRITAGDAAAYGRPHLLYVHEHLHHLHSRLATISGPALRMAEVRQRPWWR